MKTAKVTSLICGGMISLAGTPLLAQSSATSPGQPDSSGLGQSATPGQEYQGSSSSSTLDTSSSSHGMQAGQHTRLSELMHAPVQGKDGKQLGFIRDFTIDPQSGRVEFAILSLGNAAGLTSGSTSTDPTLGHTGTDNTTPGTSTSTTGYAATGKFIPVPWQLFRESWTGNNTSSSYGNATTTSSTTARAMNRPTLTLNVDESRLDSAPSFQANNWNELQQSSFGQQVYSHFGLSRSSATGMPGSSISGAGASGSKSDGGSTSQGSTTQPQK